MLVRELDVSQWRMVSFMQLDDSQASDAENAHQLILHRSGHLQAP